MEVEVNFSKNESSNLSWNSDKYQEFKNRAIEHSTVRKIVPIRDITILSENEILYSGTKFLLHENAFKQLIKFCGLSKASLERITKNAGEKVSSQLLKIMQIGMASQEDKATVCLLVDKKTTKIIGITKTHAGVLSNNAFFRLFEDTMNNHNGMVLKNLVLTDGGNVELTVLNKEWEFDVSGLKDEFFNTGLVFVNTPETTIINPFNERLICTNGMIASQNGLSLQLMSNATAPEVTDFYDTVRNLKDQLNFESEFKKAVTRMLNTTASYEELLYVRRCLEDQVANRMDPAVRQTLEEFVPTGEVESAYMGVKINLLDVEKSNYKKIHTPLKVWELVNRLTDVASHHTRYNLTLVQGNNSINILQKIAGALTFKKQFDLEFDLPQIFK